MVRGVTLLFLLVLFSSLLDRNDGISIKLQKCPYKVLEGAFKVQIDLERKDGGEMMTECSKGEKTFVSNLLQRGIEKASSQLVKTDLRSLSSFGASVCKAPTAKASPQRQLATFDEPDERSLRSRTQFFRYYGTMRCRLCDTDNGDPSKNKRSCPLDLDHVMTKSKYDKVKRAYLGNIRLVGSRSRPTAKTLKQVRVQFDLRGLQPRQNVVVNINDYKLVLNHEQFQNKPSSKFEKSDGFHWLMPNKSSRDYRIQFMLREGLPCSKLWPSIIDTTSLNVIVSIGGDKKRAPIPKMDKFTTHFSSCRHRHRHRSGAFFGLPRRELAVDAPLSSPVASPTTPAMSPVAAPLPPKKVTTKQQRNLNNGENKGCTDEDVKASKKKETSVSTSKQFQKRINWTLTLGLNQDLRSLLPVGHCMYGKGIHAKVHLTPKPEWEKKMPTCSTR